MKVVSVINYKGGVGKTTLTANLGAYAAMKGLRVLMIDLDPQTHLTFSFMTPEEWGRKYKDTRTMKQYFENCIDSKGGKVYLSSLVIPLELPNCKKIGIISSNLELANMDMDLAGSCSGTSNYLLSGNNLRMYNHLHNGIGELKEEYDLVLIDCPPNCNAMVRNAIRASDSYLIPARMDYLSYLGVMNLRERVNQFMDEYNGYVKERPELGYSNARTEVLGIVPMMVDFAFGKLLKAHKEYMRALEEEGYYLFPYLRHNANVFAVDRTEQGPVVLTPERYLSKAYEKTALNKIVHDFYDIGSEFLLRVNIFR